MFPYGLKLFFTVLCKLLLFLKFLHCLPISLFLLNIPGQVEGSRSDRWVVEDWRAFAALAVAVATVASHSPSH